MRRKKVIFASAGIAIALAVLLLTVHNPFSAAGGKGAVYFFYSEQCPHCRAVKPAVFEIAEKKRITICEVSSMSEDCGSMAKRIGLRSVPAIVINGEVPEVFVGSDEVMKAVEMLKQGIDEGKELERARALEGKERRKDSDQHAPPVFPLFFPLLIGNKDQIRLSFKSFKYSADYKVLYEQACGIWLPACHGNHCGIALRRPRLLLDLRQKE